MLYSLLLLLLQDQPSWDDTQGRRQQHAPLAAHSSCRPSKAASLAAASPAPVRPRRAPAAASTGADTSEGGGGARRLPDPARILLGRQLQILKRLKALEKAAAPAASGVAASGPSGAKADRAAGKGGPSGPLPSTPERPLPLPPPATQAAAATGAAAPPETTTAAPPPLPAGALAWQPLPGSALPAPPGPMPANPAPESPVHANPAPASPTPLPRETFLRWGHSSAVHRGRLLVVGGYGGEGSHQRRNDVLLYDPSPPAPSLDSSSSPSGGFSAAKEAGERRRWSRVATRGGEGIAPRMGHATVMLGETYGAG
jgi:hypothetical protein